MRDSSIPGSQKRKTPKRYQIMHRVLCREVVSMTPRLPSQLAMTYYGCPGCVSAT